MATTTTNPKINAESEVSTVVAISICFVSISFIIVVLRLYIRFRILGNAGLDDLTISIAEVLAIGAAISTALEAKFGLGRHVWTLEELNIRGQLKSLYSVIILYNLAQIMVKISFLFQYRRIFVGPTTQKICLYFLIFIIIWGFTQEFLLAFSCVPVSLWDSGLSTKCITTLPIWYLTSSMNIVTDFGIFLVPIPAVRSLQLQKKQKNILFSIFCLGLFTCIISIVRLYTLKSASRSEDPTWDNVGAACWTMVELNCGIVCACLPTLRPLLAKFVPDQSLSQSNIHASHFASAKSDRSRDKGLYAQENENNLYRSTDGLQENAAYHLDSIEGGSKSKYTAVISSENPVYVGVDTEYYGPVLENGRNAIPQSRILVKTE